MKIDGKLLASEILGDLKKRVEKLKEKKIVPHLYIILLSDEASSASYVKQKMLRGEELGIKITIDKENPQITTEQLVKKIEILNNDNLIHGIIVQRPMPKHLDAEIIANTVIPTKDVDGFNEFSEFEVPVVLAVLRLIQSVLNGEDLVSFLNSKKIAVIGKGITAGKPIINFFKDLGENIETIDTNTKNKEKILNQADIIISAVGRENVFEISDVKKGVILIGVGLHREDDGKFHGDFKEDNLEKAAYYSPTPGGVGPVNVSMLMKNLVEAAENQSL